MTYAAETRAESTITKRILRITEIKTLRAISGNSLRDRRRNKEIRKEYVTQDVVGNLTTEASLTSITCILKCALCETDITNPPNSSLTDVLLCKLQEQYPLTNK
ncbi:hypothetical protein M0804_015331 [Polistes exclamans]|nr:hypothetical protein M0804_015331 [Polistes exclamans]